MYITYSIVQMHTTTQTYYAKHLATVLDDQSTNTGATMQYSGAKNQHRQVLPGQTLQEVVPYLTGGLPGLLPVV